MTGPAAIFLALFTLCNYYRRQQFRHSGWGGGKILV
jgi:hypothetical protein